MPFGLVPILAQVFTVAAGDRAEIRWIANEDDTYYEAEDIARLTARLDGQNSSVGLAYTPSIIVSPLERSSGGRDRTTYILHRVGLDASIAWLLSRRTKLTATQTAGYDRSNTIVQALSGRPPSTGPDQTPDQAPPGDTPGDTQPPDPTQATDTTTAINSSGQTIEIVSVRSELALDHALSRKETFKSFIAYAGSSGVGDSRDDFPLVQGPDALASYGYRLSRRDDIATILTARYAFSANGDRAFVANLSEAWGHKFSQYAAMNVSAGVTYVYVDPADGPPQEDIFFGSGAGGNLGITYSYTTNLYGGRLTLRVGASYAPVLDQSRLTGQGTQSSLTPDVRFGVFGGADWVRKRLTLYANTSSVVSAEPNDPGALNSIGANLGGIYDLGAGFAFEAGARGGWQTFDGQELLAPSVAFFAALSWGGVLIRE